MRHVILGNGPAGVIAAETIRRHKPDDEIVLIGDEPEPPYSRMAIPYLLSGKIDEVSARVMGVGILAVEVLGPPDPFLELVRADPRVGPVEPANGSFTFRFDGDAEAASDLLARLVGGGVRVASFSRKKEGLEDLFLKVGARELS